jgi:hypothetical protein
VESIIKGLKNNVNIKRIYNILFKAVELDIDFNLFIDKVFSIKKFKVLEEVLTNYTAGSTHMFSNLVRGLTYSKNTKNLVYMN